MVIFYLFFNPYIHLRVPEVPTLLKLREVLIPHAPSSWGFQKFAHVDRQRSRYEMCAEALLSRMWLPLHILVYERCQQSDSIANLASHQQLFIELPSNQHASDFLCASPDSVEPRIPQYSTRWVI